MVSIIELEKHVLYRVFFIKQFEIAAAKGWSGKAEL